MTRKIPQLPKVPLRDLAGLRFVCVTDLVAQGALLGADVCDEVAGLLGHLVQEHVAQGQAAVSDVVPLQERKDEESLVETFL